MTSRTCVLVLGMHRSGTSALTRVLSLLGCRLPSEVIPGDQSNPTGYWEPPLTGALNDALLALLGTSWDDAAMSGSDHLSSVIAQATDEARIEIGRAFGHAELFVLKDPRITLLYHPWCRALEAEGIDVAPVLIVRDPAEVAESLHVRDGLPLAYGELLWLRYVLQAESVTRGRRRALVTYERLLSDWRASASGIARALDLSWPVAPDQADAAITSFLDVDLRHHTTSTTSRLHPGLAQSVHRIMQRWAAGGESADDYGVLDEAREQLDRTAAAFPALIEALRVSGALARASDDTIARLEATVTAQAEENRALQFDLDEANVAVSSQTMQVQALQTIVTDRERQLAELEQQRGEQERRLAEVAEQLAQLDVALKERTSDLDARSRESADRAAQVEALSERLSDASARADASALHVDDLTAQLHERDAHLDDLTAQLHERDAHLDDTQRQARINEERASLIDAELHRLEDELSAAFDRERGGLIQRARRWGALHRAVARVRGRAAKPRLAFEGPSEGQVLARIIASGTVDAPWYLSANPDVRESGSDPVRHYVEQGWHEGRDPSPHFATRYYQARYGHLIPTGMCPLYHYLTTGWRAGAWPHPNFDPERFAREHPGALPDIAPLVQQAASDERSPASAPWTAEDLAIRAHAPASQRPPQSGVRIVAHYLPQFHPIPENDRWWGDGFTEWTNVRRGRPRFPGHRQPHRPVDDDYYDLRDERVLEHQVELARTHGIDAFCFYAYWFDGTSLLEQPVSAFASRPDLDLGFCLCWANESWTRTWDGSADDILIEQRHSPADDLAFIAHYAHYLRDPRYLRHDGAAMLYVYRPSELPDPRATADRWRTWARANGVGELHLVAVESFEPIDPIAIGFDSSAEFWPNAGHLPDVTSSLAGPGYPGKVYDWTAFVDRSEHYARPAYPLQRGVCLGWDNEARRPGRGTQVVGATPDLLRTWLRNAALDQWLRHDARTPPVVLVNAWNEWAEGCHLEPDVDVGYQWLHAVRDVHVWLASHTAAQAAARTRVLVVVHDLQPHGAQWLGVRLANELHALGHPVAVATLREGELREAIDPAIPVQVIGRRNRRSVIEAFAAEGFRVAITNSVASAGLIPILREAGMTVTALVNELPTSLEAYGLLDLAALAGAADCTVFPADFVRDSFPAPVVRPRVRPQGLLDRSLLALTPTTAGPTTTDGVVRIACVAYAEWRKGFDRFVELATLAVDADPRMAFFWVGRIDATDPRMATARANALCLPNVTLVDHTDDYARCIADAHVLLVPSREDPFPNVALDATAIGLPVLAVRGSTGLSALITECGGAEVDRWDADEVLRQARRLATSSDGADQPCAIPRRKNVIRHQHSMRTYAQDLVRYAAPTEVTVSVLVPSYNHACYLPARLDSIRAQSRTILEAVVSDDASTDGSAAIARDTLADWPESTLVLANERNSGAAFTNWARLIPLAHGDLIWIAESDDVSEPDFLEYLVEPMQRTGAVLGFCMSAPIDEQGRQLAPSYAEYLREAVGSFEWHSDQTLAPGALTELARLANPILTVSSVVFRADALRAMVDEIGHLAGELPTTFDWLAYATLGQAGPVVYRPEVKCLHRRHADSVIGSTSRSEHLREVAATRQRISRLRPGDR